ncbi:hypothetical protein LguiA_026567 [Lonicera macranthoides]
MAGNVIHHFAHVILEHMTNRTPANAKFTVGSQVVSGTINNFIARAAFIEKVEAAGVTDVELLKDQEGEGSSSNEVLENPGFLNPVDSFFEHIFDMTDIPLSELEGMYTVRALDLSNRSIKSLPDTISSLVELR